MKIQKRIPHFLVWVCLLGNSAAPCSENSVATKILVDGNADEWQSVPLLIEDARSPVIEQDQEVDVHQVKAKHDLQNLYLYVTTTKSLITLIEGQSRGGSSSVFVIYLDIDGDATTGCRGVKLGGANGKTMDGFEFQLVVSAGRDAGSVGALGATDDGPFASYDLYRSGPKRSFSFSDRKKLAEKYSIYRKKSVALCQTGIELALPLAKYGIESDSEIRLLIHKQGYMDKAKYPAAVYSITSEPEETAKAEKPGA